jgi:Domain of unknown function (DUF4412)
MSTISALLLLAVTAAPAGAAKPPATPESSDVYFEQTTVAYAEGRPSGPGVVSRVWYGGQRLRMEAGGVTPAPALILRLDKGKAYRVDPAEKTVAVLDANRLRTRGQMDSAMAGELMGADNARVTTTPLPGERTIAGHRCRGFRIKGGTTVMDLWVTSSLPIGIETFAGFLEWSGAADSLGPFLDEIRALPGFPLQSRSRVAVMGETHETVATVTLVKVGAHDKALFDAPAGYRLIEEAK